MTQLETTEADSGASTSPPSSADLHPGPGFRVRLEIARPDPTVVAGFAEFPSPDISDLLNRLYAIDPAIQAISGEGRTLCGPACTVRVFPGDNLMVHKALDVARPGDVVVVAAGGSLDNAVVGDTISAKASHRGIAGFIVDGLVRDVAGIRELDYPVYARGATPVGPLHRGPGEINYPVACGGVVVNPGDIVVADESGIVIVPSTVAAGLLARLRADSARRSEYMAAVRRGKFSNAWVDAMLAEHGCVVQ